MQANDDMLYMQQPEIQARTTVFAAGEVQATATAFAAVHVRVHVHVHVCIPRSAACLPPDLVLVL